MLRSNLSDKERELHEINEKFVQEKNCLLDLLNSLRSELNSKDEILNQELTVLRSSLSDKQKEFDELNEKLIKEKELRQNENQEVRNKVAELEESLTSKQTICEELSQLRDTLNTELSMLKSSTNDTERELRELNDGLSNEKQAIILEAESLRCQLNNREETLGQEISLLRASLSEKEREIQEACENWTKEREFMQAEHQKIKTNMTKLETEASRTLKDRNDQLAKMNEELLKLKQEVKTLKTDDNIKQFEIDDLRGKFSLTESDLRQTINELNDKCALSEQLLNTYKHDIQLLDKEKSELRTQLIETTNDFERFRQNSQLEFETKLKELNMKAVSYKKQYEDSLNNLEQLERKFANKERDSSKYESMISEYEHKVRNSGKKIKFF
jgi:chromosome segregation ATPase